MTEMKSVAAVQHASHRIIMGVDLGPLSGTLACTRSLTSRHGLLLEAPTHYRRTPEKQEPMLLLLKVEMKELTCRYDNHLQQPTGERLELCHMLPSLPQS